MSKQKIDVTRCPFCEGEGADRAGFDVMSCRECGSQWRVTNAAKLNELRQKLSERFPDAHAKGTSP